MTKTSSEIISKLVGDIIIPNSLENDNVTVAEICTYEINGFVRTRDTNTALISSALISKIRPSHINVPVEKSGVNSQEGYKYSPSFWLYLSPSSGLQKAEPLVVSWTNGNHTTLLPDQGFLSTYGLSPRLTAEINFWDDLSKPQTNVVENRPLSIYEFPSHSEAYVRINKEYLQNYITLREKVAIQVFREIRDIEINDDILFLLDNEEYFIQEYRQYEIRLSIYDHKDGVARLEVNGYRELLNDMEAEANNELPGHYWKGIDGQVTGYEARHNRPFQYVYVSDDVLEKYEQEEGYQLYPDSGSVQYGVHWAVSHCDRVGRNAVRLELKKLYEGTPYDVIDHWNKFTIHPDSIDGNGENVVTKANRLVRKYLLFGRGLSSAVNRICDFDLLPSELITLNEKSLDYEGYSQHQDILPIMHHVSAKTFAKGKFITRCKKLYMLLGENLRERNLRKVVDHFGFKKEDTKELRSVKLLELIIKYLIVAHETGLDPKCDKKVITERIIDFSELEVISELSALNAIRQLDAHKSEDFNSKFDKALDTLGLDKKAITSDYSDACHNVYDSLTNMLSDLNNFLVESHE